MTLAKSSLPRGAVERDRIHGLADEKQALEAKLGELLISRGKLDSRSLDRALKVRTSSRDGLLQLLSKLGLCRSAPSPDARRAS